MEASLNAAAVLNELVEIEKTFEIFWLDNAALVEQIIDLAIDPSNQFNQKYLLSVLIGITKQLKPSQNPQQFRFRDMTDEEEQDKEENKAGFDPESPQSKKLLRLLQLTKENDLIYNLMLNVITKNRGAETMRNQ
jgi:hypothetical protein